MLSTSLSKRSNVPGMRSGFVAGDAAILKKFLLYRTYHGSGACRHRGQRASIAAWQRRGARAREPREVLRQVRRRSRRCSPVLDVRLPDAAFYLWANVARSVGWRRYRVRRALYADYNVTVLPGSLLARTAHGTNPGARVSCASRSWPKRSTNVSKARERIVDSFCGLAH
jgi:N-succinyldiaminopimelate aminotransferase